MMVNYMVPGTVPHLQQPIDNTCWATVATMMKSWQDASPYTITEAMAQAGPQYTAYFNADEGLRGADKPDFLRALVMAAEAPQNYAIDGWLSLLKTRGILWVTTNEGTDQFFAIHARIIRGIAGDGTPDATFFTIVDPADGQEVGESLAVFTQKFESVACADLGEDADLRPQVVHF